MNAFDANTAMLAGTLEGLARPAMNIVPTVMDFGGQSEHRLASLARAAGKIADAVHGGQGYAQMMRPEDFEVLKRFVAHADAEFAIAQVTRRDDTTDRQYSRDSYDHFLDREKL